MKGILTGLLTISLVLTPWLPVFAQSDLGSQRSFSLAPSGDCPVGLTAEVVSTDADNGKKYCCPSGTWMLCPEADRVTLLRSEATSRVSGMSIRLGTPASRSRASLRSSKRSSFAETGFVARTGVTTPADWCVPGGRGT